MGTRTYSRRGADGVRRLTAAGKVKFNQVTGLMESYDIFGNIIPDQTPAVIPPVLPVAPPIELQPPVLLSFKKPAVTVPLFSDALDTDNYANVSKSISNMTPEEQNEVLKTQSDNFAVLQALGMYGTLENRQKAFALLEEQTKKEIADLDAARLEIYNKQKNLGNIYEYGSALSAAWQVLEDEKDNLQIRQQKLKSIVDYVRNNSWDNFENYTEEEFRKSFAEMWYGSGSWGFGLPFNKQGSLSNPGWAMMHQYLSQVGPNADVPYRPDFWADGVKPPPLNPKVLARFQKMYEDTQKELANEPDTIEVWRRTAQPYGLAAESWADRDINWGMTYSGSNRPFEKRVVEIPKKYILLTYQTGLKVTGYDVGSNEREITVLGSAALHNANPSEHENRELGASRDRSY
jgi:hypothetical protein